MKINRLPTGCSSKCGTNIFKNDLNIFNHVVLNKTVLTDRNNINNYNTPVKLKCFALLIKPLFSSS